MKQITIFLCLFLCVTVILAEKNSMIPNTAVTYQKNSSSTLTLSTELSKPVPLYPLSGSVFKHFPRHTVLTWEKVFNAASYTIEVDCFHCCQSSQWCTEVGKQWIIKQNLTTTVYDFDFVGAQPGRWRVWAVSSTGEERAKTDWQEFRFTQ